MFLKFSPSPPPPPVSASGLKREMSILREYYFHIYLSTKQFSSNRGIILRLEVFILGSSFSLQTRALHHHTLYHSIWFFQKNIRVEYSGLPTKHQTSETTVRNLYRLFPYIHDSQQLVCFFAKSSSHYITTSKVQHT